MKKNIKSILGFMIGPILAAGIGFITTPILTFFILPAEYARINYYQMFQSALAAIVYLGFDQAYIRFFNEEKDKEVLLINSIIVPLLIGFFISIFMIFNIKKISYYMIETEQNLVPVILLIIFIPFSIIERFLLLWLRMQEKSFLYSFCNIILKILILSLTIILLLIYDKTFVSAIYGSVLGQILFDMFLLVLCLLLGLRINVKKWNYQKFKELAYYGIPLALNVPISIAMNSADRISLKQYSTLEDLGLYGIALKITGCVAILKNCITTFWVPISLRWYAEKKENKYYLQVTEVITWMLSIVCLLSFIFKGFIFNILDEKYSESQYIFPLLMFYPILYTIAETFIVGITFQKKGHLISIISAIVLIINIGFNIVLTPTFGALGAAAATAISNIIYFLLILYYSRKLWYRFECKKILVSLAIICLSAILNVVVKTKNINIYNILFFILLLICFRDQFFYIVKEIGEKINEKNFDNRICK